MPNVRSFFCFWVAVFLAVVFSAATAAEKRSTKTDELNGINAKIMELIKAGKFAEAVPAAEKSLALSEQVFGTDTPNVAVALNNLAKLLIMQNKHAEAEPLLKRSLAIRETEGSDSPDMGAPLYNLADVYQRQGRVAEAEPLYRRALNVFDQTPNMDPAQLALTLNSLGNLYFAQGKYDDAEPLYKRDLAIREKAQGPEHVDVATSLYNVAEAYRMRGRYLEAEPIYLRALAIRRKAYGDGKIDVAWSLSALASVYVALGRYGEADPLYTQALAICEKTSGVAHINTTVPLDALGQLRQKQARYGEAEAFYKRALAVREKVLGPDHQALAVNLFSLGVIVLAQGRTADAIPIMERGLAIRERFAGPNDPEYVNLMKSLEMLYRLMGRQADAEALTTRLNAGRKDSPAMAKDQLGSSAQTGLLADASVLMKDQLALDEKKFGAESLQVAGDRRSLGVFYRTGGRHPEAEPLLKRALAMYEKALGPEHLEVATTMSELAALYAAVGRNEEALQFYGRTVAIRVKTLGIEHPDVGTTLSDLADVMFTLGNLPVAENLYVRALAIREKTSPDQIYVAASLTKLGLIYAAEGRYDEAEASHKRALAIREKAFGPDNLGVADSLRNLAWLYQTKPIDNAGGDRSAEIERGLKRALEIDEKGLGPGAAGIARDLNSLGMFYFSRGDWTHASEYLRRGSDALIELTRLGTQAVGQALAGGAESETVRNAHVIAMLVKAKHRLAESDPDRRSALAAEAFQAAQWARGSEAAASLAQMGARAAQGSGPLAQITRERQDLVREWRAKDKLLFDSKIALTGVRDVEKENILAGRLSALETRVAEIDHILKKEFSGYAALINPEPLSIMEVQAQLAGDEALVFFLDTLELKPTPQETFIWVVTKTDSRWARSSLGTTALTDKVQALRCGLDDAEWDGIERPARCAKLLGTGRPADKDPLPFSFAIAHEIYDGLLGPVADLIAGKRLLIVPSGSLTSLPFQVLISEVPPVPIGLKYEDYHKVTWLARQQSTTVLPSVATLKSLRAVAKASPGSDLYTGYGNPALAGNPECRAVAAAAETCPDFQHPVQLADAGAAVRSARGRGGRRAAGLDRAFRNGSGQDAVLTEVRSLCPLPDTAQEIRCVAKSFGVADSEIHLGAAATEAGIKGLSESGRLADYKVIHFATHGLLAGDVESMAKRRGEPALVLTPPKTPSGENDEGLLTASEVTQIKLNADWVILSACNTAAGDKLGAEALSGLARAFFYAGARALLVSHWPVYSDAAVWLITDSFGEMKAHPELGRSEAQRRAMLALMDNPSQEDNAHPSVWAPFVVVGEGGAVR